MEFTGVIEGLYIASESEAKMRSIEAADAVAGRGLRGDRYFNGTGRISSENQGDITLIETEAIEALAHESDIELEPGAHRRNVETRGVPLNHLVDEKFIIGDLLCEGLRLCEPCATLERNTQDGVLQGLLHRGGLRVDLLETGIIEVGDQIEPA